MSDTHSASPCRAVVLISGSGSNLQRLVDLSQAGQLAVEIVGVLSNRADAYGLARAEQAGIHTAVLDHKQYDSREAFDQAMQARIDHWRPDVVILAGFMRILSEAFVLHYQGRMLNIHPSLLPKYRGLNTHQRALEAGEREHGCSVHFVTAELDGGPLIAQAPVTIEPDDSPETLAAKVQQREHQLYPACVQWFATGRLCWKDGQLTLDGEPVPAQGLRFDGDYGW